MGTGEQLFVDEHFEHEGHPVLFTDEILAKLALGQSVELN